uniref:Uncharacterized protein n=1 Tax=Haptolina ericina TaxID=156174 RepID=A0A7S3AUZ7_9EUKA
MTDDADATEWDDDSLAKSTQHHVIPQLEASLTPASSRPKAGQQSSAVGPEAPEVAEVKDERLAHVKVRLRQVTEFEKLWDTVGTNSHSKASIWAAVATSTARSSTVCLGHYASASSTNPPHKCRSAGALGCESLLELADTQQSLFNFQTSSSWLAPIVESFLVPPVRLAQCWSKRSRGQRQVYAWEAVPPEGFVAMGMLCSTEDDGVDAHPPPIESIRCVPRSWVRPSRTQPQKVWDDSGSSGTQGSIWVINNLRLIAVTAGHEMPAGPFYEFKSEHSFLSELIAAHAAALALEASL